MALDSPIPGAYLRNLGFLYSAIGTTGSLVRPLGSRAQDWRQANEVRNRAAPFVGGITTALNSLFVKARALRASAGRLVAANGNGVFSQRVGTASQAEVITVTVGRQAEDATYQVSVAQLAQAQQNIGFEFDGGFETRLARGQDFYTLTGGRNFFTITSDATTKSISFEVTDFGGSLNTLKEIALVINVANVGVKAEVVHDDRTVTNVRLQLTSTASGEDAGFSITDSAGNTIRVTGSDRASLAAQDANYAVDGALDTAPTNTVSLQAGEVKLQLRQAFGDIVEVEVARDRPAAAAAVVDFVEDFNDLLALLANGTFAQATRAKDALGRQSQEKSAELEQIGISRDRTGRLKVDDEKLESALRDSIETVGELLGGSLGLATRLLEGLGALPTTGVARLQTGLGAVSKSGVTSFLTGEISGVSSAFAASGFAFDIPA